MGGSIPGVGDPIFVVTNKIFADPTRLGTYTEEGSFYKPYRTVQAALNAGAASGAVYWAVEVIAPCTITENLVLPDGAYLGAFINGNGYTIVNPASGLAFDFSSAGVTALDRFVIQGFNFQKAIQFFSPTDGAFICATDCTFKDCTFIGDTTVKNVIGVSFDNCHFFANQTFENIGAGLGLVTGGQGNGSGANFTLVTNNAHPKPSGFSNTVVIAEKTLMIMAVITDAGSSFQAREGVRLGSSGISQTVTGIWTTYGGVIRSPVTVASGGTFTNNGSAMTSTLTVSAGGTYTGSGKTPYTPADGAKWTDTDPRDVWSALDRLAAAVYVLQGNTAIS